MTQEDYDFKRAAYLDKVAEIDGTIARLQSDRNHLQNVVYMMEAGVEVGDKRFVGFVDSLSPGYVKEATFTHVGGGCLHFDNRGHGCFLSDTGWRYSQYPYNLVEKDRADFLESKRASL